MDYIIGWKKDRWLVVGLSFMTVLVVFFSFAYVYMMNHMVTRYQVFVGTERIGAVNTTGVIQDWLRWKQEQAKLQYPGVQTELLVKDIHYIQEREYKATYDNAQVLERLEQRTTIGTSGVQIRIDGKPLGVLKDEAAVKELLDQYKNKFVNPETQLQSVEFVQKVDIAKLEIKPDEVGNRDDMLKTIETGGVQPLLYTVQRGDCISCIAYKFHISQKAIYDNNPFIKNTVIHVGEVLNLTVQQPLLSVKTVEKRIETAELPFGVEYIDDNTMKAGSSETITTGENGLEEKSFLVTKMNGELVSEALSEEKVLQPAKKAVVKKGTKIIPGEGTGIFAWPVYRPKLTSDYGQRWGSFHPGTDMVSEQSGILASDHGKVVFAGWKTGYGNCIIIDHQNGYSTLYGHLSKIGVSNGETVQKGEKIGIMGSTGNATGIHLHFEVRKGESQQNPLKFLGKLSD
ncbi:M23 family metallopeptidase [Paenibacillus sp. UNC451MF]|uniref:M23 family metallopeptidase n=1 Tax=Paenibacillus sp. UNC451MF TaxID=1449063 RepID=UPI00069149A2|nr:M23 family metallopeptidase [Paenibacillus sp. UNC451MF]